MRQRPLDRQFPRLRPAQTAALLQQHLQRFDHTRRQLAQVRQRPLLRPTVLVAIRLPQQNRRRRVAIRDDVDEHALRESQIDRFGNPLHGYSPTGKSASKPPLRLDVHLPQSENFGLGDGRRAGPGHITSDGSSPPLLHPQRCAAACRRALRRVRVLGRPGGRSPTGTPPSRVRWRR